ncbi:undecaprenyl-phosphate glucose phosphotransferase [Adhaeribacter soli]|uniref:Undecaprenyl-phosphate glucose phosphotransferase n=1 Tax=Adhaeribacter soli TaxID=2607655 RepID=A0A5N1J2J8_9BACT|nr:undecaprenyl-phosphate glucose phosphotransferase [Adhaeribacter soli]KAA9340726.1 undecaprenyl-phosphate glucose phosphotransferase [Adhaeribacter soli]
MTHKYSSLFKWVNVVTDYLLLNVTFYAVTEQSIIWMNVYDYKLIMLVLNLAWFFCSDIFEIYNNILTRDAVSTMISNTATLALFAILGLTFYFIQPELFVSTGYIVNLFFLFAAFLLTWKVAFLFLRRSKRKFWISRHKVAIVGATPAGIDLYNFIAANPQLGYDAEGIFDDNPAPETAGTYKYLGKVENCISYASTNNIQEVYCALRNKKGSKIGNLRKLADKHLIRFRLVPYVKGPFDKEDLVEFNANKPLMISRQEPLEDKINELKKRVFDIVFSSVVIVFLLSWLIPLIAIIIKLDSKGPVFFKQLRSGKNNKPFYCYKFRSMAPNADSDRVQASKDDMRITRVGRILRKTSLDELPQFFNVLMGDMSVVGPRPHMLKHTEDYSELINNFMVRHFITPGITGWAQVNGYRGETKETESMLKRVQADIWYLEHWTLFLDLKIVFLTIWRVMQNDEKAY